jgi:diketogulonate reductase-like aldo/keto reductase
MESTQIAPTVTLSNGVKMPVIGVGTFFLTDEKIMVDLLRASLDIGYRYIDTAVGYNNHAQLGKAL